MSGPDNLKLSLNGVTLRRAPLETQIRAAAAAGFRGFGLWMDVVDEHLAQGGTLAAARDLLTHLDLPVTEACFLPDWQNLRGADMAAYLRRAELLMNRAASLGSPLVVASAPEETVDWDVAPGNLRRLAELAAGMGLRVAYEFLPWGEVRDVARARKMLELADHSAAGLLVDSFHFYLGGSKEEDLLAFPKERLFLVHLDDVPALDADLISLCRKYRVYPGEGTLPLRRFGAVLHEIRYDGFITVELLSEAYWQQDPFAVARRAYEAAVDVLRPGPWTRDGG